MAWLGLAWLGLAWLGLAWLGLAWLGRGGDLTLDRTYTYNLVLILTRHTLARAGLANRLF